MTIDSAAKRPSTKWYRRRWVQLVGAGALGLAVGSAGAAEAPDPTQSAEYKAQAGELRETEADLREATLDSTRLEAQLDSIEGTIPEREEAVETAEADIKARTDAVKAAERAVAKREQRVGLVEREIARNTFPGEGVYRVGQDVKPGTYRSAGNGDCYWSINADANGANIINNGLGAGQQLVTLSAGTFFETTRCGDWVLQ